MGVISAYRGVGGSSHPSVSLYFAHKVMADLGYTFSGDNLDDIEAQHFLIIANKITELQEKSNGSRRSNKR